MYASASSIEKNDIMLFSRNFKDHISYLFSLTSGEQSERSDRVAGHRPSNLT